ncbi:diguanylate cyclase [Candidatus Poribacteria bacterium]|nr:diguanylate cyclase [Candidatus Poribacteria bacterium]
MSNKILIVNNDYDLISLLYEILNESEYIVSIAKNVNEAIQKIDQDTPNLIITDSKLSAIDDVKLETKLKNDPRLSHLPIIMLIEKYDDDMAIESLKNGIDDFIIKPFKEEELLAKIHLMLFKFNRGIDINPLTSLPGNNSIKEYIEKEIFNNKSFAVCFLDIDHFKSFNDKYGFARGDEALKLCAQILSKALKKHYHRDDFIGHIGGDDFVIITSPGRVKLICDEIISQFDENIKTVYNKEDISNGYIISKNRQGHTAKFSIMSISIGVVTNEKRKIIHSIQVSEIGNELKKYAKSFGKSNYVIDKREIEKTPAEIDGLKNKSVNQVSLSLYEDDVSPVFYDIKKLLKEKSQVALLFIEITPTGNADYQKINDWEEMLNHISDIFLNSRSSFMRKSDQVSIYNNKNDKIFVFLSPPRRKKKIDLEDVENIIKKIKIYFENNQKKFGNKIDIIFGYSVLSFPN